MPEDLSLTPIHPVDLGEADDDENGQVSDEELTALAGPDAAADTFPYYTADHGSPAAASVTALTEFARSLLADPDQASMRTTLGISGSGAPLTDMEALKAEGGGEILVHETDPGEDGTGTDLYLSQDGLGVLRALQVRDAADTPFVDFGADEDWLFAARTTTGFVSSNRDPVKYPAGEYGLRLDQYGNFLIGRNRGISATDLSGGSGNFKSYAHFYYRYLSNFLYAGAGLVVQDVSDNPEYRIGRFGPPRATAAPGAPLVVGSTPVTILVDTTGTDPDGVVRATTTANGASGLDSTTITVQIAGTAGFYAPAAATGGVEVIRVGGEYITYTGKTGGSGAGTFTGCGPHAAITNGTTIEQTNWRGVGANAGYTAWPDVDFGGRACITDEYPYTIDAGGATDYAGIIVVQNNSGEEPDPDQDGIVTASESARLGSIIYKRVGFGPASLLEAVGAWGYADGAYTLSTTPQDITLQGPMPRGCKQGGTLLRDGSSTIITYTGIGGSGSQGLGTTQLMGCTVPSGTLAVADGQKIYQRIVVNDDDQLILVLKPEPRPGAGMTNFDIEENGEPVGSGRFGARAVYLDNDAVAGADRYTAWGDSYASMGFQMTEPHTETKQGGQLTLSTASTGTKGAQQRLRIESYGLANALYGISIGEKRDLTPKNSATPSVLGGGQYALTDVNQFTVDNTGMSAGSVAVTTSTPGSASANEVQLLTLTGTPVDGDTFALTWVDPDAVSATSGPIATDTSAGDLLAALQAMFPSGSAVSLFQPGDLAVTHPTSTTWQVTFGSNITGTRSRWALNNTVDTTITNITDAVDGQLVTLRTNNAHTTIAHLAGGDDDIRLASGDDVALAANEVVTLVYDYPSRTWNEIGGSGGGGTLADNSVTSAKIAAGAIMNTDVNSAAAIDYSKLAALTASRALVSDSGGKVSTTSTTSTQVQYLSTATSNIQTQLNAKQPLDNELTALATATAAANKLPYFTGSSAATTTDLSAFGRSLIDDADAAAHLTTLGITASVAELNYVDGVTSSIQTQINALSSGGITDPELLAIAALTSATDTLPYFTGSGTAAVAPFTSFGRDILAEGNAPDVLTLLGLNIVTPESFAAAGDGTTDDTAALQNWIDADGIKVAPPGKTYLISGTLTIADPTDIDLNGSYIKTKASSTGKILVTGSNVTLRNLIFDGNRSGTSVVSQGIEWRGTGGLMVDCNSSHHNDCEGGIHLITGTPELDCVRCQANDNGARAALDAGDVLRVTSYTSVAYGVDGFSCNAGVLRLEDCRANHNSRCGVYIGESAGEGCVVDIETHGNASGLVRKSGTTNQRYDTYAGMVGAVTVRSNVGEIKRCIMDGRDENDADATRYGCQVGYGGGAPAVEAESWKVGYVAGSNFRWQNIPNGSAADVMHIRGGHYTEVDTLYCSDVAGYGLVFGGGSNNVALDNAIPADHNVNNIYARYVSNPPVVCSVGRRLHVGTVTCFGSAPISIGEGSASVIETLSIDRIVYYGGTTGVFVNGGMDESTGTMENVNIGTIEAFDCNLDDVTGIYQTALVSLYGPTNIGRIYTKSKSGEPLPDYIVSVDDTPIDGTPYAHEVGEIESVDYNTAKTLVGGTSTLTVRDKSRTELVSAGAGLITAAGPEGAFPGVLAIAGGTAYWNTVGLKKGDVITNLVTKMTTAGSTLSLAKMCVATVSGTTATVVAVSASVTSTFTSGPNKYAIVPCSYTAPADGLYYIGILVVGTTGPSLVRQNPTGTSMQIGSNPFQYGQTAGQTNLVLSSTYTVATSASAIYLGAN